MAEALALLSLTCNILQLLQTGFHVAKDAKEIYASATGSTHIVRDLRLLLEDIKVTARDVRTEASNPLSGDEKAIKEYSNECEDIVSQLVDILTVIEPRQKTWSRKLDSVRVAAQLARKKGEIGRLQARLQSLDDRLRRRLSTIMDERRHSSVTAALQRLNTEAIVLNQNNDFRLGELQRSLKQNLVNKCDFEDLKRSIDSLAAESTQMSRIIAFFKTLRFPEIQHRFSDILEAHQCTIHWAFDDSCTTLPDWLENGSGIYWITGLAGSGKSTFMKYVVSHASTAQMLRKWGGELEVTIASFFFWNLGLPMQKSQQGLYQSLLFQMFRHHFDLIEKLCPDWDSLTLWTRKDLDEVFDRITTFDFGSRRFCIFIDGLDEYDGEEDDVIHTIKKIASCPNIKICVSSRPWNAFLDEFGDSSYHFAMQDFTESDINEYISQELIGNKLFVECLERDSRFGSTSEQLTKRAKGVWLWVHLIVKGLKRDLRSRETFEQWQNRIESVPPDLAEFFRRMLARLDPIHKTQTARTFLVVLYGENMNLQPFSTDIYTCLEKEANNAGYLDKMTFRDFSSLRDRLNYSAFQNDTDEIAKRQINERCRDLLHAKANGRLRGGVYRNRLEFLHRTARDFFRDTYYEELYTAAGRDFTPAVSIVRALLAMFNIHPLRHRYLKNDNPWQAGFDIHSTEQVSVAQISELVIQHSEYDFETLLCDFWKVISQHETFFEPEVLEKFDELASRRLTKQWVTVFHTGMFDEVFFDDRVRMIAWCLCMRLSRYVEARWQPDTYSTFLQLEWSPLRIALPRSWEDTWSDSFSTRNFNGELLQFLLDRGVSPNEPHFVFGKDVQSAGYWFLRDVSKRRHLAEHDGEQSIEEIQNIEEDVFQAVRMLLQAGLDLPPGANDHRSSKLKHLNEANFRDRLAPIFGETKADLLSEIYQNCRRRVHTNDGA